MFHKPFVSLPSKSRSFILFFVVCEERGRRMALAGILRRSKTKQCAFGFAQVAAQRNGALHGDFPLAERWTAVARAFSAKGAGSDIIGNDLGTTNLCVAVMEGKVPARVPNGNAWVEAKEQQYSASQTGALALGKLKGTAEFYLGRRLVNSVITLPSYFNNIQKQAVNNAGRIAGFSSLGGTTFEGTTTNDGASVHIVNPNRNINRPLSPHLSIYEPQLTSTYSIFNRISGAFLTAVVLSGILLGLEIGPLSLTYHSVYQYSFYANLGNFPKLTLSLVNFTVLAFCYHLANGLRHICWDMGFFLESPRIIRISEFLMLCIAFSAFAKIIQKVYF